MKTNILLTACLITIGSASYVSHAQTQQPPPPGAQEGQAPPSAPTGGGMQTPDDVVARMSGRLNLSDDQKAKITPIIADRQSGMKALMADTSSGRFQKAKKLKAIMSDSDKKIEAVLTPDQSKTYQQMIDERREQMRSRMQ